MELVGEKSHLIPILFTECIERRNDIIEEAVDGNHVAQRILDLL